TVYCSRRFCGAIVYVLVLFCFFLRVIVCCFFFFSSRRRHTRFSRDWSSDVCSSDLIGWTFLKLRKGDWLRDKKVNILYQMSLEKHPELPNVPAIIDRARTPEDRKVFEFLFAPQEMGRPFFTPPGVPPARLAALRLAFERTLKDSQFLADADKMGLEVQHVGGEAIEKLLERLYASPR